ncbi:hypothetical protein V8G54_028464 [Vigna mungo]|uniref:Leucine-rich repeat-containing N-terminal plant-type domain-containing protein n=1 Tax=Vigna mungo TaxID=3915 RepID=A0AAQ3RKW3_VIGMU
MAMSTSSDSLVHSAPFCPAVNTVSVSFSSNHKPWNALHALRSRLSDPNNVLQSWDPTLVNPCTWFHVTCDSNNHVIRLDLGNSNVSGTLGPELGQLQHLQYLYGLLPLPVIAQKFRN